MPEPPPDSSRPIAGSLLSRIGFIAALFLVVAIHTWLFVYFAPPKVIFSAHPMSGGDFSTHFSQASRVIEGLQRWGESWVYDVHMLAGHPNGAIFDADNKGWELWTYALYSLGLPKGFAFNTFVLAAHFLLLPVLFISARLFGLGNWPALICAALGSALWYFDSLAHFNWYVGLVSYAVVSYLFLLPLALFYGFVRDKRWWQAVLVAILTGLCLLIHPYAFFLMALPMAVLYLGAARRLGTGGHAAVAGIALFAIAMNAYWLLVAFRFWHYILNSAFGGQATLRFLPADFFGLLLDPSATGVIGTRTGFRFLCFGAALLTLILWRRARDPRFAPLAAGLGATLLAAYLGGYFKPLAQIQPYRFMLGAIFLSLIPAADLVELLRRERVLHNLPLLAWAVAALLALPGIQHLSGDAIYFFRDSLPRGVPVLHEYASQLSASGYPPHYSYRYAPYSRSLDLLARWIKGNQGGVGRVLVQHGMVGEELSWRSNAEILGGFPFHNLKHAYSNLFRRDFLGKVSKASLQAYLENYAVKWLVVSFQWPWFDDKPDLLKLRAKFADYRVYEAKIKVSLFQQGSGKIRASTNRIEVSDTDPAQPLVLRYHWMETLVCEPGCSIKKSKNPLGGVPFILVPAPHPRKFVIRNAY